MVDLADSSQARAVQARVHPQRRRAILGAGLVVLSTFAIAIVPTLAKLSYDAGSNTLTVITARSILSVALTALVMLLLRQSARIPFGARLMCWGTGLCYAAMLYGFLGAVEFIPVNTVILIFFLHPILVGLLAARLGDRSVTGRMLAALAAAFVGLGLAVGFSFDMLNAAGLALAALSTVTGAVVIIGNGYAAKQAGGLAVVFHMMLSASLALAALFTLFGSFALPHTTTGWLGFGGVALCSTIGTLAFFCAVPMIGTVRATMISNVEPLIGILFAVVILGERLSMAQGAGIALVLVSIAAMEMKR